MKIRLRKNLALFLTLCMCLSLCPVTAFAGTEMVKVEAVTATAQPLDSSANDPVTLTTASVIPQNCNFYVKFDGLEFNGEYRILVQTGSYSSYRYLYAYLNEPMVDSLYYNLPLGDNTVTLTICDDNKNALYQPVALTTQVVESIPVTMEELQAGADPSEISVTDTYFTALTYLPLDTLPDAEGLSFEVVKDGVVYAATAEDAYCRAGSTTQWDPRYAEIFDENTYIPLKVQMPQGSVYCGRELVAGSYDVRMYVDGELYTTHKDAIVCYDTPMVSCYYSGGAAGAYNVKKSELAACVLRIANGDPSDFEVTMLKDDEVIGSSNVHRLLTTYGDGDLMVLYYIPVDEPLENRSYFFEITHKDGADFILQDEQPSTYVDKLAADDYLAQFGSYYYANFVLSGAGYDAGVQYKFELGQYNNVIATTQASPNNDGIFNVEFRDEDGQLIELQEECEYEVSLYSEERDWPDASWYFYNYHLRREESLSLMSADTYTLNVTGANTYRIDGDQFYVWVNSDEESIAELSTSTSNYKLRMTSATGKEVVLSCANVTTKGVRAQLYFDIPNSMEDAYYLPALLYKDKLVVNTEGVNILKKSYLTGNSSAPDAESSGSYIAEVYVNLDIAPMNLYGRDVTVDFYSFDNFTAEADHQVVLAEANDYALNTSMLAGLNPAAKYLTVMSVDGVPVSCSGEFEYWTAPEQVWNNDYENCDELTVAEGMEDYLELIPCHTQYDEETGLLCFSEVYVNVTAPEGKALQYITVNGEKICGNGFLFTEDCEVSAIFAEPETETYKATVQMGIYDYVYSNGMTDEEVWEYAESLSPEEMEAFYAGLGDSTRVFKVLHSYERNLSPNTSHELDLTLPAELNKYKVGYIDVECADTEQWSDVSHDGTETRWFLRMPECDVVVKVELEQKQSSRVSAYYTSSLGTVTGLPTEYVMEGETVSFTATPNEGNLLQEVYYEYYDYRNGGDQHIVLTPDEDGVYSFVMPAAYVNLYVTFSTSGPYNVTTYVSKGSGTVTKSNPASEEGYMAGEVVTLTLAPSEGYRLVPKTGLDGSYWISYNNYDLEFTKINDTTYTFVMPHSDVSVAVSYEETPGVAPGGTVTDNDTLITALGGAENAALNAETGAVQLLQDVELLSPVLFNPTQVTEFILDLNGHRIIAVEENTEESGAIILHQSGLTRLKLENSTGYGSITTDGLPRNYFHLIWVRGGKLTAEPLRYITMNGAYATYKNSAAVIRVVGGEVEIKNDKLSAYGECAGEGLWASSGTTIIQGGSYHGGYDYYNQMAGELGLLGGVEEYDWVTSRSLGGSGIRVSGKAVVEIQDAQATGGPNSAALYIDNVALDTPCKVDIQGGSYYGEYGKGLLVRSATAELTIHGGEFYAGYPYNADYSVDVSGCGVVADYLAPDRKVENLDDYLGYDENYNNIYGEMSEEDLQRSYLYYDIRVSDGPATLTNAELDKVLEELSDTITPEDITNIQTAVSEMEDLAAALEKDTPDSANGTTEKLAEVEALIGEVTIEIENEAFRIDGAQASITGAVINAGGDVTLIISQAQVEEKEEIPEECRNVQHFSLELTANGEEVTLSTPVKVVLPVPANINPALLMILHYDEQNQVWEIIEPSVYQVGDQWYMTFVASSFSDFAVAHNVSVLKDSNNGGIWVTLDVHQNAAEDQQFLCAVYSEQGQLLGTSMVDSNAFIDLDSQYYNAYELKVFTTSANNEWVPKYDADIIPLTSD